MKYSEGDWTTIGTTIFLNNDYRRVVAQAFDPDKPQHTTPTAEANAHLVKAAPAMYETLKALLEHLTMPKGELGRPYMADVKRMAYKALASAEGE